jgi:hypothetical protein
MSQKLRKYFPAFNIANIIFGVLAICLGWAMLSVSAFAWGTIFGLIFAILFGFPEFLVFDRISSLQHLFPHYLILKGTFLIIIGIYTLVVTRNFSLWSKDVNSLNKVIGRVSILFGSLATLWITLFCLIIIILLFALLF